MTLNGRTSLLGSYLPLRRSAPRLAVRARPAAAASTGRRSSAPSTRSATTGPLAVEWKDAGMNREYGAEEACKFVKRLDFEPAAAAGRARRSVECKVRGRLQA